MTYQLPSLDQMAHTINSAPPEHVALLRDRIQQAVDLYGGDRKAGTFFAAKFSAAEARTQGCTVEEAQKAENFVLMLAAYDMTVERGGQAKIDQFNAMYKDIEESFPQDLRDAFNQR